MFKFVLYVKISFLVDFTNKHKFPFTFLNYTQNYSLCQKNYSKKVIF